jgi:hypothetical protein
MKFDFFSFFFKNFGALTIKDDYFLNLNDYI